MYRQGSVGKDASRGLDLTVGYDWSPSDVNKQNTQLTVGARYIGLIPRRELDSLAVGLVHTQVSDHFGIPATALTREQTPGSEQVVEVSLEFSSRLGWSSSLTSSTSSTQVDSTTPHAATQLF